MSDSLLTTDIAVIGAGPVGLFAVFEAGMLGLSCALIDALDEAGGQCSALYPEKPIYDIPGYPRIAAQDLVERLREQAAPFKPRYLLGQQAVSLTREGDGWRVGTSKGESVVAKAVIVAAGAGVFGPNRPPLQGIERYEGRSVFYLVRRRDDFKGKRIVIAGGGDSAVDWALALAEVASRVMVVHRRPKFRAAPESKRRLNDLAQAGRLDLVIPYQLHALEGDGARLDAVVVQDLDGAVKRLRPTCCCRSSALPPIWAPSRSSASAWSGITFRCGRIPAKPTCPASTPSAISRPIPAS
jgi:thioredoxin reductase (NADPH)